MIRVVPSAGVIGLVWVAYASYRIRSWRPILRAMKLAFAFGIVVGGAAFPISLSRFRGTSTTGMGYQPPWEFMVGFMVVIYALFGMTFGIGLSMVFRDTWIQNGGPETADLIRIHRVSKVAGWILMVVACAGCPLIFLV